MSKGPIRVLHEMHWTRPGGVETLVLNLYRHMDRDRVQFDFTVRDDVPGPYSDEIKSLGGRIIPLPWRAGNPLGIWAYQRALATVLTREGPFAAVHSHMGPFSGHTIPVAREAGVTLRISHSHNTAEENNSLPRKLWTRVMRQQILSDSTHLLACSQAAADWLFGRSHRSDPRIWVFNNAIDLAPFEELPDDRKVLREELGLPADATLIGHVGRFERQKNHVFLLRIFTALQEKLPDAVMILVGDGKLRPQVQGLANQKEIRGKVSFLGIRSDVPRILGALDLFLFPSLWEGLGMVLIEAQAAGIPCLASDVIPAEADLQLGLLWTESLQRGPDVWSERVIECIQRRVVSTWETRKDVLISAQYDAVGAARMLQTLYGYGKRLT